MFKKFVGFCKSKYAALAVALGLATVARAEGEASTTIDLSVATTQLQAMKDAIVGWIGDAAPVLVSILGAALVITLIFVGAKWVTRGTKKAG